MNNVFASALSSMNRIKQEFAIASHNIANADEPDFAKISVNVEPLVLGGMTYGVDVKSLSTYVDENMQNVLYAKISKDEYNQVIKKYLTDANNLFGNPSDLTSLDSKMNNVFSAIENLSRNPASASLKLLTVQSLDEFSTSISNTAESLYKLKQQVDMELFNSIGHLNSAIDNAYTTSQAVYSMAPGTMQRIDAEEKLRKNFEELSKYFDLYKYQDDNGMYRLFSTEGDLILGDISYFFKYDPLDSLSSYINEDQFKPVLISSKGNNGYDMNINVTAVQSGKSEDIPKKYNAGKIGGLLAMRDIEIPKLLDQLDVLSVNIKDAFNTVHNLGAGFPPASKLIGTRSISSGDVLGFSGNARIAIVDRMGQDIAGIDSLKLNFDELNSGKGAGRSNLQTLIDEINFHFGSRLTSEKKIEIGGVSDIKMAFKSSQVAASSNVALDLEIFNLNKSDVNFALNSVSAKDASGNNILDSFSASPFIAGKHSTSRTANAASVNLALPSSVNWPFTIDIDVTLDDGLGPVSSTLRYIVNAPHVDPINGVINSKVSIDSKVNASDSGVVVSPNLSLPVLTASLIDINGNLNNGGSNGFLKLETSSANYTIVIDSMDSLHSGSLADAILPTNQKFSHFFGLNDLFVRSDSKVNSSAQKNAAVFLDIRDDIKRNASLLSKNKLANVLDYSDTDTSTSRYQIGDGDNTSMLEMLDIAKHNMYFGAAGGLPSTDVTFSQYVGMILSFSTSDANKAINQAYQSNITRQAISDNLRNSRGVDVNEELTNIVMFQQSFAASAQAIKTAIELYDILFSVFK